MRLQSVHIISKYKNLSNFKLDFDGNSFIDVFVGKNGTGKSNLFEALIEIYRHLYEFNKSKFAISFDYSIKYEIAGTFIEIDWKDEKLFIDRKERKTLGETPLPDNVLIYYSGHNSKISDLIKGYEEEFKRPIQTAAIGDTRRFIGIGKEYKQLLLSTLLLQPDGNHAKQFILNKLGISKVGLELKVILQRPFYAKRDPNKYDVDPGAADTRYWKPLGITADFLHKLEECKIDDSRGPVHDSGYYGKDHAKYPDQYILYYDVTKIEQIVREMSAPEFFRQFDNLKTIEMLRDVSLEVELNGGVVSSIDSFSDGQFQSVYIYSIMELFKDRNCLTLLDEPDSFLHPEWQFEFLKQVFEIAAIGVRNNHVLMSSHSAVTLVPHNNTRHVKLFELIKGRVSCHDVSKKYAVDKLAENVLRYSEKEQILSILNSINIEKKSVLFTEGSTDPIIIKEAWCKLYKEPIPFIPIYALNCIHLRMLLQDERVLNELGKKPLFGLFDFDEAYNEWNYLKEKKACKVYQKNPYKGLSIGIEGKNSYALMLPVPKIPIIEKQVVKDRARKITFCHKSRMAIEHLFYGDPNTHIYFDIETIPGGSVIIFKEDKKTIFANDIVPKIAAKHFEVFRPIFEFIISKCGVGSAGIALTEKRSAVKHKIGKA